jgi:hypothetical protein
MLRFRILYLLFLGMWIIPTAVAASTEFGQSTFSDSTSYELRVPDDETLIDYSKDRRFRYADIDPDTASLWERFKQWLFQHIYSFFMNEGVQTFLEISFYLIFLVLIYALIRQFMGGEISSALFTSAKASKAALRYSDNGLQAIDYDASIRHAAENGQYRQAVNLIYNKALHELHHRKLIDWKTDKTNRDYLFELSDHRCSNHFRTLTRIYEYAEYGDFPVNRQHFEDVSSTYQRFEEDLSP